MRKQSLMSGMGLLCLTSIGSVWATDSLPTSPASPSAEAAEAGVVKGTDVDRVANSNGQLEEITVTAQHRTENAQNAPIAIDTVSSRELVAANILNPTALATIVPSLQVGQASGPFNTFYIRGVGSNATNALTDSAVSLSIDGVSVARQYNLTGQFFDLDRVEVLEGPQGTLYGRNATGGAINLVPVRPGHEATSDFSLSYGNYNTFDVTAAANVPIADTLLTRFSFQSSTHDGYLSDGEADDDTKSGRVQILSTPIESLSILFAVDFVKQGGRGGGDAYEDNGVSPNQRIGLADPIVQAVQIAQGLKPVTPGEVFQNNRYDGAKVELNWDTDFGTLTVIPSHRDAKINFASPFGGLESDAEADHQNAVEARFASNKDQVFTWIGGLFYLHDKVFSNYLIDNQNDTGTNQIYNAGTDSKAAYGDATIHLTDTFRFIGGVRYTHETKSIDGTQHDPFAAEPTYQAVIDSVSINKFTYRAGLQYDVAPASMLYATYSTGFHSGGFFFTSDNPSYQPETITAYTIGSKNRFFDNSLQVNLEIFDWQYRNQQVSFVEQDSAGDFIYATANAGATSIKGTALDVAYRFTDGTRLGANVQYLNSVFTSFTYSQPFPNSPTSQCSSTPGATGFAVDCRGQTPPNAPKWVFSPTLARTFSVTGGGSVDALLSARYQSHTFTSLYYEPSDVQNSYATGNAAITYNSSGGKWSVTGFANNLGNDAIKQASFHQSLDSSNLLAPRIYGVRFALSY